METVAALATPPGRGAIAIVRTTGPAAAAVAARVARTVRPLRPRVATRARIVAADGALLDDGLALFFPAPHSYTGEDVVELHLHGSPAVAREALLALLEAGARPARPGEFTRRAFLAGKLDLSAAEAVADTIAAEHRGAVRAAAARLAGGLATIVDRQAQALVGMLEELSAALDFPGEVAAPLTEALGAQLRAVDAQLAELTNDWERGRLVREGIAIAIVGPPNAGKSSMLNALLGVERALVSEEAGTTRDTIEESVALGNGSVGRLVDTAGLRPAASGLEAFGIARSERALADATLVLVVVDGSRRLDGDAAAVLVRTRGRERVVVFNKADLGTAGYEARETSEREALSATTRREEDVERVRAALLAATGAAPLDTARPTIGTLRQADAVYAARRAVADARATLARRDPVDLIAGDLATAHAALASLTGRDASEAVLDGVFARFCIGK